MKRIMTIVGARPQFVKSAVVSRAIAKLDNVEEFIIHTGQHFDPNMSDVFFDEMEIPAPYLNLEIRGGTHGAATGAMIAKIEEAIFDIKPDMVLLYGDTNSTLAGAISASKLHIPVAHVEAGLRSFNKKMPEEVNRILTDHVSALLLCPTSTAVNCLKDENIVDGVSHVGDVMYDASLYFSAKTKAYECEEGYVLCTVHRAENTDVESRLRNIVEALSECGKKIVLPLHPRTKKMLTKFDIALGKNFEVIEPVPYGEMVAFLKGCDQVVTDSGGLQKEAYFFKKPCVTVRDETEWRELVEAGVNQLVGADKKTIMTAIANPKRDIASIVIDEYGIGETGDVIANIMSNYLS